mmetsp:Transcript_4529/g.13559  ORF Transcript_4529/g.13559 Transcript_4529/m.13559 type:complete len:101 (+) Transcript_4529:960-1262(+)
MRRCASLRAFAKVLKQSSAPGFHLLNLRLETRHGALGRIKESPDSLRKHDPLCFEWYVIVLIASRHPTPTGTATQPSALDAREERGSSPAASSSAALDSC